MFLLPPSSQFPDPLTSFHPSFPTSVILSGMESKVYVAIGTESYDGFTTLQWTLNKWSGHGITIVIIHGGKQSSKDYVYTPLGKLHVSAVSEEKLQALEKAEEARSERILSNYIDYCGKVKVEVIKLEKTERPLDQHIVELISSLRITKLVMSFAFMKSSSPKSRTAISGSFHVLRHKPDFCKLFVICGGRLVSLRDDSEEGLEEDDRGNMFSKIKERNHSVKNWLGKMFPENAAKNLPSPSKANNGSVSQWEKCREEIEQFADELMALHEGGGKAVEVENGMSVELNMLENVNGVQDAAERIRLLKCQVQSAEDAIQLNKRQVGAAKERIEKARWAISICNARAEELEACVNAEVVKNAKLNKELDGRREEVSELEREVEEKRKKLDSILELQRELSGKLHLSSSAKACAEGQLEKAVRVRADVVQEIEELRIHRNVLNRRIEFCREKDAIGKADKSDDLSFNFREFSAAEVIAATEDFSERFRLKSAGRWTNVYKCRLYHITVAVKVYDTANARSPDDFATKVKLLQQLRHPHVVGLIGFCSELNCLVYEYMHNRSLHDVLFSGERSSRKLNKSLTWHTRIRIATEICLGLAFLHKAKPKPIVHQNLEPSKILLDRYNVAKISGLNCPPPHDEPDCRPDIRAFGNLLVQLLTGKKWEVAMGGDTAVEDILDCLDGEWPMDLAVELYGIAMRCLSKTDTVESITEMLMREIAEVKRSADQLAANSEFSLPMTVGDVTEAKESNSIPSGFLCPIYQDVMKNPHLAADGFSYEFEAIDEWLKTGHDTSPMTNLKLKHKLLTPNRVLRSLIEDWQNKRFTAVTTQR